MMSTWIKVNFDFGHTAAYLTLSYREAACYRVRKVLTMNQDDPEAMERELHRVILDVRPELAGGNLFEIGTGQMYFRFGYCHPSLPRVKIGQMIPEMNLIPHGHEPVEVTPTEGSNDE